MGRKRAHILVGRWLAFNTQDGSARLECLDTQRIPDLITFIFELGLEYGQGEDEDDMAEIERMVHANCKNAAARLAEWHAAAENLERTSLER